MKLSLNICAIALLSAALFTLSSCVVPYDTGYSGHSHHDYDHHGSSHYDGGHYDDNCHDSSRYYGDHHGDDYHY